MIKTILMLGFMCSSLVAGAWFLKKLHGPSIRNKGSPASLIELIDKKSLSAKSVIWYARIDGINHIIIESQYGVAISRLLPEKQSSLYEGIEKTALNDTL